MERILWPSCGFVPTVQIALLQASAGRAFQCIDGDTKLTDCKYLLSLYESTTTANYGAPRNLTASVTWKY